MKKGIKAAITIAVFAALAVAAFSYFFVSGKTVANIYGEYEDYEVTITKYSSLDVIDSEVVLNLRQKEMLKQLFTETSFRRVISDVVFSQGTTRYEIRINGTHEDRNGDTISGALFNAGSMGGEYLSISNAFNGKHLKIYNSRWSAQLDEIIALSGGN